jgi:hypothetical protein
MRSYVKVFFPGPVAAPNNPFNSCVARADVDHTVAFTVSPRKKTQIVNGWNSIMTAGFQLSSSAPSGFPWYLGWYDIFEPGQPLHASIVSTQLADAIYKTAPFSQHPLN